MEIRARHWMLAFGVAALAHAALVMGLNHPPRPAQDRPVVIQLGEMGAPEGAMGGGEVAQPLGSGAPLAPMAAMAAETVTARPVEPPPPVVARAPVKPSETKVPKPVKERPREPRPKPVERAARSTAKSDAKRPSPSASASSLASKAAGPGGTGAGSGSGASGKGAGKGGSGTGKGVGSGVGSKGVANYQGTLAAWLNRHKRYPDRARRLRQEGTVRVSFTIDRGGRLISHRIVSGSGHPLLDQEVQAMVKRASPMPPFPAGMTQSRLTITVPISFDLR